jgi:hypothetical protein
MARKKVSRNAPCLCGSGKKYKHCCYRKGFDYRRLAFISRVEFPASLSEPANALGCRIGCHLMLPAAVPSPTPIASGS